MVMICSELLIEILNECLLLFINMNFQNIKNDLCSLLS